MRRAEQNLDKFWHKVDRDIESKCGELGDGAVRRLLTRDRTLQRTPEWIQPLFFDDQTHSKHTLLDIPAQPTKEKIKTRKPGNPEASATQAQAAIPQAKSQTEPLFAINVRALKVFKTLFFPHSATSIPGEVLWVDFLYAMMSVGFVPQKLYGSVWQFNPDTTRLAVQRSIQFHELHGANSKVSYWMARRHGRRLSRAYGWDGSSFTLEEKTK
ncbi:hypothetical protein MBLNU13_g06336t1 [Cladosporium sp. NU13]